MNDANYSDSTTNDVVFVSFTVLPDFQFVLSSLSDPKNTNKHVEPFLTLSPCYYTPAFGATKDG